MDIHRQTHLVSFAVVKIAAYTKRKELRDRLTHLAFDLIEAVAAKNVSKIEEIITALQGLVSLGKALYEIEPVNADTIMYEAGRIMNFEFKKDDQEDVQNGLDISNIFSTRKVSLSTPKKGQGDSNKGKSQNTSFLNKKDNTAIQRQVALTKQEGIEKQGIQEDNAAIRQSAMKDKIRQIGEAKLKDIIAEFPEVSERTIRYDLQRLCGDGSVERVGAGGPGSFYRIRVV